MSEDEALNWLAELFGEAKGSLQLDTPRSSVATWDSLGVLTLMAGLDETFDLVVNDADMRAMQKVGDVIALLRTHGKVV
jgi:acyl carrier protein